MPSILITGLSWLKTNRLVAALGMVAVLVLVGTLIYWAGRNVQAHREAERRAAAIVVAAEQNAKAHQSAATQRAEDIVVVQRQREELRNALEEIPDSVPDDHALALACSQLLHQGDDISKLSACSGFVRSPETPARPR